MIHPFFKYQNITLYNNDCRAVLNQIGDESIDLVFIDPPFNIGWEYDSWDDNLEPEDYYEFLNTTIISCKKLLKNGGIFLFHVPDQLVEIVFDITKDLKTKDTSSLLNRIDWIIWHYQFGQCGKSKFINSKAHCLVYKNGDKKHIFNANDIMVRSLRSTKYKDKRTLQSSTPGMRVPFDVFTDIPRLVGNAKERVENGRNQLPEKYLERLIKAYTNVGNVILDPCSGTGTTLKVCQNLGRVGIGIEISKSYCDKIVDRIYGTAS